VATFDRRNRHLLAPLDRRRTYVDVMERVLGSSGIPEGRPQHDTRIADFTLGPPTATVRYALLGYLRVELEEF
jgi:hypothetical protein